MPLWQRMSLLQRSYVPLQWADSIAQMVALTEDRISSFEQKVHLVGFSMGGYIASVCACQSAEKIASLTLIGYNPQGLSDEETRQRNSLLKSLKPKAKLTMNSARLGQFLTPDELKDALYTQPILDMESDLGNAVLKAHIQATTPRKDMTSALVSAPFPVNFITAQQDKIADCEAIAKVSSRCIASTHLNLENTAHMMLLSQPENIAQHIFNLVQPV